MESMEIDTAGYIKLDGWHTGLRVVQIRYQTVVTYVGIPPFSSDEDKRVSEEIKMPHPRYSLAYDNPKPQHEPLALANKFPPPAGRAQFERDIRAELAKT